MSKADNYIGSPCAVIMCVDAYDVQIRGRLYHAYRRKAIPFTGMEKVFLSMEELFNNLKFPFPGTEDRSFIRKKKILQEKRMIKVMNDDELLRKHGDRGTFIIRVKYRQHSSWQGLVTWAEKQKTVPFRSALELMKMIDEALGQEDPVQDERSLIDDEE